MSPAKRGWWFESIPGRWRCSMEEAEKRAALSLNAIFIFRDGAKQYREEEARKAKARLRPYCPPAAYSAPVPIQILPILVKVLLEERW